MPFIFKTGVRQGCLLCPLIFLVTMKKSVDGQLELDWVSVGAPTHTHTHTNATKDQKITGTQQTKQVVVSSSH